MIDLHHHLIYGVDDGPADIEHSLTMARASANQGVTHIVCTPHASELYPWQEELVQDRLGELRHRLAGEVSLSLGCDFHLSIDNIEDALKHPMRYSIEGRGYLLVEFPNLLIPPNMEQSIYQLQSAGYTVVITHPERCMAFIENPARLATWIQKGCYVQVTGASLYGRFGRGAQQFSNELLERHWIHFLATDAHHMEWRPPHLRRAYEYVANRMGSEYAQRLCRINPQAALAGTSLPSQPEPIGLGEKSGRWMSDLPWKSTPRPSPPPEQIRPSLWSRLFPSSRTVVN